MKLTDYATRPSELKITVPVVTEDGTIENQSTNLVLHVVGTQSSQYSNARRSLLSSKNQDYFKEKNMDDPKKVIEFSEEVQMDQAKLLASCVLGWSGFEDDNGNEQAFDRNLLIEYLTMPEMGFLIDQLQSFISDPKNFYQKKSVKN